MNRHKFIRNLSRTMEMNRAGVPPFPRARLSWENDGARYKSTIVSLKRRHELTCMFAEAEVCTGKEAQDIADLKNSSLDKHKCEAIRI